MKYKAVLFDMIGTTVKETDPNTVLDCLQEAFTEHRVLPNRNVLQMNRGKDKLEMINIALDEKKAPRSLGKMIYDSFKTNLLKKINNFRQADGALETFSFLKRRGILVGLGTGMEREIFETILNNLGWNKGLFDYVGVTNEIGRSRPNPDMIWDMMKTLNLSSTATLLKVGDTVADIQEGKNTGCDTVAVASGTQEVELLRSAAPNYLIDSLTELQTILLNEWPQEVTY